MDKCQIRAIIRHSVTVVQRLHSYYNLRAPLRGFFFRTPGLAALSAMSSKVQPREQSASTTKIQSRVGPETKFFVNSKGKQIHCSYWRPADSVRLRGLVFLCHGFAEHLQWYEDLALRLTARGLLAFGHDHVGHGRSGGVRGHVETVDDYVEDVLKHCDDLRSGHPGLPCFLVGHSMGGMIAIRTAMARPRFFKGVVLMGPLIRANPAEATPVRIFLARLVARVLPYVTVAQLKLEHVTRDQDVRSRLKKDPLRYHGGVRARWAMAVVDSLQRIEEQMDRIEWPFFILHGEADLLCAPTGSRDMIKRAASGDKELKVFPAASHNLFLELSDVRLQALQDTVEWITARLPSSATTNTNSTPSSTISNSTTNSTTKSTSNSTTTTPPMQHK